VNPAFLDAINAFAEGYASEDLIDTMMSADAKPNVDSHGGEALKMAARNGNSPLLKKLVSARATTKIMAQVFAEVITAPAEEEVVLSLLSVLAKNKGAVPNFMAFLDAKQPPILRVWRPIRSRRGSSSGWQSWGVMWRPRSQLSSKTTRTSRRSLPPHWGGLSASQGAAFRLLQSQP